MSADRPGWRLTFEDHFDRPQLNDLFWYPAYRSGRKEYFQRIGRPSRWQDHNAHYVIEDSCLKLRLTDKLPFHANPTDQCVSCCCTSDHRFGATTDEFQLLEKFGQRYGWFETRCRMPRGSGLMSAFWLHQCDPTKQEFTPEGERKGLADGVVEIDIFEQQGRYLTDTETKIDVNVHFTEHGHLRPSLPVDASADFHVWAMEWDAERIVWYLNGEPIHEYLGPTPSERMFVLLALFQYSGWIGEIDPATVYPKDFEIDYVRVYQREE